MNDLEKRKIIAKINCGKNIFLTGSGGTGKTYLIKEAARETPQPVALTAMTGIAALGLSGLTLHSFAGLSVNTSVGSLESIMSSMLLSEILHTSKPLNLVSGHHQRGFDREQPRGISET